MKTRIVQLTASRIFVGQHLVEIPSFCLNDRFRAIVAHGGATSRVLSARMNFGRVVGTGLAQPLVSDLRTDAPILPDIPFIDIASALREDGFIY